MNLDVKQTAATTLIINTDDDNSSLLEPNSVDCLSTNQTNDDENQNCPSEDASNESVRILRNGLRNVLRGHNRVAKTFESTVTKKFNSPFNQLIEEAKLLSESDFELAFESSSFFSENDQSQSLANTTSQPNSHSNNSVAILNSKQLDLAKAQNQAIQHSAETVISKTDHESTIRKVNKRKNQIELIDDFEDDEYDETMSELNRQSVKSSSRDSQADTSLKELRNFKNQPNGLQVRRCDNRSKSMHSNRVELKPIQRVYIDNNRHFFRYETLLNVNNLAIVCRQFGEMKKNQDKITEKVHANDWSTDHHFEQYSKQQTNQKSIDYHHSIKQNQSSAYYQALIEKCLFKSTSKSDAFVLYTFQDNIDSRPDRDDCQTSIVALIQLEQISIWTKGRLSTDEWIAHYFELDENQQVFRCTCVDRNDYVLILFLVFSHSLVSLKYCLIDKETKCVKLVHGETFEVSNIDLNLIHLCFVGPKYIALSIPRIDDDIIDVLIYDQFKIGSNFNKSKRIIYMLHNVDNKFSSHTNCFLTSDEQDHIFLAIFNQKLFMCNVNEYNKLPRMISLHKYADSDYSYFDVLYDKGIFYLFAGNHISNNVRIIALNIDRCLADKLIKYDIEKCLDENRLDGKEIDELADDKIVRSFKRKGDHLIVIKNDDTIVLFNMFSDKIVYQNKLTNVHQAAIAILNQKTTILAVMNNTIVNLVDL